MSKNELRRELKRERGRVPKDLREQWNQAIFQHLSQHQVYAEAHNVMTYLSFGWEIDTWQIAEHSLSLGKEVYVPVVQSNPKGLVARRFTSREALSPAVFGILEPGPEAPAADPEELDLILVPGLAFSPQGYRIGYGGGYYDRFLASTPAKTVGLVYQTFVRDVPVDPWDRPVDFLATDEGVFGRK
nr:5-formyltetrahydrofolate cyclo-ligase [Bacillota bacterium]